MMPPSKITWFVKIVLFLLIPQKVMCYSPLTSFTNSHYINTSNVGTRLLQTYNCGKCAECLKMKHLEYYLRTSAEYYSTIKAGGFVYWETLTYDDEHIPVLMPNLEADSGEPNFVIKRSHESAEIGKRTNFTGDVALVFNRDDYRNFFKRLRINLTRSGYVPASIKYFFVSEYGKTTHRPHYHTILFVKDSRITPEILDEHIRKAWTYGTHFDEKHTIQEKVLNGLGACNYVAKYVNKDTDYIKVIDNYCKEYQIDPSVYSDIYPFHCQSQAYGRDLSAMEYPEYNITASDCFDLALNEGKCYLVDKRGLKTYPLPMYNIRKLFFDVVKDAQGKTHWEINDVGVAHKERMQSITLQKQVEKLQTAYDNIQNLNVKSLQAFNKDEIKANPMLAMAQCNFTYDYKKMFDNLLNGRTLLDLAIYNLYFRGRLHSGFKPNIQDILRLDSAQIFVDLENDYGNQPTEVYRIEKNLGLCYKFIDEPITSLTQDFKVKTTHHFKEKRFNLKKYAYLNAINEDTFECFHDFDKLLNLVNTYYDMKNNGMTLDFRQRERKQDKRQYIKKLYHL